MVEVGKPEPQVRVWYWHPMKKEYRFFTMPFADWEKHLWGIDKQDGWVHVTEGGKWKFSVPADAIMMVEAFDE